MRSTECPFPWRVCSTHKPAGTHQLTPRVSTWESSLTTWILHGRGADTSSCSKPRSEGALKGWKWCYNLTRMLLLQNFATVIHVINLCLYFSAQRDNCTWMLVHGCTEAKLPSYTGRLWILQQSRNVKSDKQADFLWLVTPKSHMLFNLLAMALRKVRTSFLPFEKYQRK